jgi:hypothetical protein
VIDAFTAIKRDFVGWIDLDPSTSSLHAARDIYHRMRTTKFEMLCIRTIRDSRRKYDHIVKYRDSFQEDVGDFHDHVYGPLVSQIDSILSNPPPPEADAPVKKGTPTMPSVAAKPAASGSLKKAFAKAK